MAGRDKLNVWNAAWESKLLRFCCFVSVVVTWFCADISHNLATQRVNLVILVIFRTHSVKAYVLPHYFSSFSLRRVVALVCKGTSAQHKARVRAMCVCLVASAPSPAGHCAHLVKLVGLNFFFVCFFFCFLRLTNVKTHRNIPERLCSDRVQLCFSRKLLACWCCSSKPMQTTHDLTFGWSVDVFVV